ncbi:hypothetical protein [Streptomyces sp. NPDC056308]|uniref:hypothetical protein n=1 Tax=Streptomyces sp. NPDC056308 TaxID=3345780 RepID=UPI0035D92326
MDSLGIALDVKSNGLLKDSPDPDPWRPASGIAPQPGDAEPVTLAATQAMTGLHLPPCRVQHNLAIRPHTPHAGAANHATAAMDGPADTGHLNPFRRT